MTEQATPTSDTPLSADSQHLLKEAYIAKSAKFNGFFDSFASEYKLLKKITHECQTKCYSNELSTIKEAEGCARSCLKPYLTFKKITGEKLQNCEDLFQKGEFKCVSDNIDTQQCYRSLNEKLGNCLKQHNTFYAKSYATIFKDFDQIVEY